MLRTKDKEFPFELLLKDSQPEFAEESGCITHCLLDKNEISIKEHLEYCSEKQCSIDSELTAQWLNPYIKENIGILASSLGIGFGIYFIPTPVIYYMVSAINIFLSYSVGSICMNLYFRSMILMHRLDNNQF